MIRFLRYAVLRSLYVLLALGAIWGSLLWGPWLSLPLAIVMLRLHAAMKPDLIEGGAHIVPYGIYRASSLLNSFFRPRQGWQRSLEQHPDYRRR